MRFHAVLLYINDQFPDISTFKRLQEVGRVLYPKGAYLYNVEQELIADRFYWMYNQTSSLSYRLSGRAWAA